MFRYLTHIYDDHVCVYFICYRDPKTDICQPIYVPENKHLDFRFDCKEKYPKSNFFIDIAGSKVPVMIYSQQICNMPLLLPGLISSGALPDEDYIQCFKLGGYTSGRAKTHCSIAMTTLHCKLGYLYFDQRCFKKFDPRKDSEFSVSFEHYDDVCQNENSYSVSLMDIDQYTEAWINIVFLYYERNIYPRAIYRIPVKSILIR